MSNQDQYTFNPDGTTSGGSAKFHTSQQRVDALFDDHYANGGADPAQYIEGPDLDPVEGQRPWMNEPLPAGWTPDGNRGYMARDQNGELRMNPAYDAWRRHNDQRFNWRGFAGDLAKIGFDVATVVLPIGMASRSAGAGAWRRRNSSGMGGDYSLEQITAAIFAALAAAAQQAVEQAEQQEAEALLAKIREQERRAREAQQQTTD